MRKMIGFAALAAAVSFAACDSFGQAMTAHTDLLARADGHELTIDEAASLLAQSPAVPAQREVVDAIANLWVDYTLLATVASQDSTLETVDVEPMVRPQLEQQLVWQLRDEVIEADTVIDDEELRRLYEEEQPELEVRARHILLRVPEDATPEQRDSVRALAEELQQRAAAGEDFAALAEQHSADPGSASDGGDLGYFGRDQMVPPFEDAAFALDVGEVSDVVETPFGYHVIKVEDRRMPELSSIEDSFRQRMANRRQIEAEDEYIRGLTEPREITVEDDAYEVARELANTPNRELTGRAATRALASYEGGKVTAADYLDFMRRLSPSQRAQYAGAEDEALEQALTGMARNEILVDEARRRTDGVPAATRDSLLQSARRQLRRAVRGAGFMDIEPQEGETRADAIDRTVHAFMGQVLKGEENVLPLGPVAYTLREGHGVEVFRRAIPGVIEKVRELRPANEQATPRAPNAPPVRPQQQNQR